MYKPSGLMLSLPVVIVLRGSALAELLLCVVLLEYLAEKMCVRVFHMARASENTVLGFKVRLGENTR